jgi:hypothetical protein
MRRKECHCDNEIDATSKLSGRKKNGSDNSRSVPGLMTEARRLVVII